jgi:hypothetical protein
MVSALPSEHWYALAIEQANAGDEEQLVDALSSHTPTMVAGLMERQCILQCKHCIYQTEQNSSGTSAKNNLTDIILNMVRQLPPDESQFVHVGRILEAWHIPMLAAIREARPDVVIGMIDNGAYARLIDHFRKFDLRLSALDVSVDGIPAHHELQRGKNSYRLVEDGLRHAREVTLQPDQGGKVTSLFTATRLNFGDVSALADMLVGGHLIDELHVGFVNPARPVLGHMEVTKEEFRTTWENTRQAFAKYNTVDRQRIFLEIGRLEEIKKIASVVGADRLLRAVRNDDVLFGPEGIRFFVDNLVVDYRPASLQIVETFLIDSDGTYRTPFSASYTLAELQAGKTVEGVDVRGRTIAMLDSRASYPKQYARGVDHWWRYYGHALLQAEVATWTGLYL